MKKNILVAGIILVLVLAGLFSCRRDYSLKSPVSSTRGTAFLRIIDAAPNFRKIYGLPDTFNVFINGSKITANTPGTSVVMSYNNDFPTVSSGYGYVSVPAGVQQIKLSVAGVVNPDSIQIQTFTKTLLADQLYTFMITDSITSTRDSSQIFVKDTYQQPTTGYYNLRFIHAVWNDTARKKIDIWSTRANRNIFTGVTPGTITTFTQYPYNALYNDTFFVRRTYDTTYPKGTVITLDTLSAASFSNQRTYTLYYRGDANSNSQKNTKRRHLAIYVHQ